MARYKEGYGPVRTLLLFWGEVAGGKLGFDAVVGHALTALAVTRTLVVGARAVLVPQGLMMALLIHVIAHSVLAI
ncbi:MAG: hypothetical protein FWD79_04185 [Desulfobulbus sp.]|nr:hypothetical protein [Desulfobulbus sp.]